MTEEIQTAPAVDATTETKVEAPVAAAEEVASDQAENEEAAASSGEESPEAKPRKKGTQQRFNELTTQKYQEQLRANAAEERAKTLERRLQELEKAPAQDPGDMPQLESFTTIDDFNKAIRKWKEEAVAYVEQKARDEGYKKARTEDATKSEEQKRLERHAAIGAKIEQATLKHADFKAVVGPVAHVIDSAPALAQFAVDGQDSAEIFYHLAKNDPAMLDEISRMSQFAAWEKLTDLGKRLKAAPPPKKLSQAPDPIKTVGSQEAPRKSLVDLSNGTDATAYIQQRQKKLMAKP